MVCNAVQEQTAYPVRSLAPTKTAFQRLSLYYHNSTSLRCKSKSFFLSVLAEDYDIICVCETWLTSSFKSTEFFPDDYLVYRKDRYSEPECNRRGGGILIAVKTSFRSSQLFELVDGFEIIAIRIMTGSAALVLCLVYIPSNCNNDIYHNLSQCVSTKIVPKLNYDDHLIILGDFNLPEVRWELDEDTNCLYPVVQAAAEAVFLDSIMNFGTKQVNNICNDRGRTLDLIFSPTELNCSVSHCEDLARCTSVFHKPLNLLLLIEKCVVIEDSTTCSWNFNKADYVLINRTLADIDWVDLFSISDISECVEVFYDVITNACNRFVPRSSKSKKSNHPWYNFRLTNIKNRRIKAHKRFMSTGDLNDYEIYSDLRREFRYLNDFLYNSHLLELEAEIRTNSKKFWSYVETKHKTKGFPASMFHGDSKADTQNDICELFAKFFSGVYNDDPYLEQDNVVAFNQISISPEDVHKYILNLDERKSPGPDGFPSSFLRRCVDTLSIPLAHLFTSSLRVSKFPERWKLSYICPIHKGGLRADVENYRGVAIISSIPKLFESIVEDVLLFHLKNHVSSRQHGFFPGRSTTTNLMLFNNYVVNSVEKGFQVDTIYTDFSKAFDKVSHEVLLDKMSRLNSSVVPLHWIKSYLSNRQQFVKIGTDRSSQFRASSGVPQGSHLGPLLFILMINDVLTCFHDAQYLIYADDLKIYLKLKTSDDAVRLQCDLNRFSAWTVANKLALNVSKCSVVSYSKRREPVEFPYQLNNQIIQRDIQIKDLGVTFSHDLSFGLHIQRVVAKANSMLGFVIRHSRDFTDPYTLKSLFVAHVRPHLEYGVAIWSPFYDVHSARIESVQKRFLKYALRLLPSSNHIAFVLPPYKSRCSLIALETLSERRNTISALFARDLLMGRIDCPELLGLFNLNAPERPIRMRDKLLHLPTSRTNYGHNEAVKNTARRLNDVAHHFDFVSTRATFRRRISSLNSDT